MRYLPHSFYLRGSKISVEPHQMYIYHMSKKSRPSLENLSHCFVFHYWYVTQNLSVYSVTPRTLCHLRVQTYQNTLVYESSNYEHLSETNIRHRRCQVVYIFRMPLYPSISLVEYQYRSWNYEIFFLMLKTNNITLPLHKSIKSIKIWKIVKHLKIPIILPLVGKNICK